jgi:hypothetical protein
MSSFERAHFEMLLRPQRLMLLSARGFSITGNVWKTLGRMRILRTTRLVRMHVYVPRNGWRVSCRGYLRIPGPQIHPAQGFPRISGGAEAPKSLSTTCRHKLFSASSQRDAARSSTLGRSTAGEPTAQTRPAPSSTSPSKTQRSATPGTHPGAFVDGTNVSPSCFYTAPGFHPPKPKGNLLLGPARDLNPKP